MKFSNLNFNINSPQDISVIFVAMNSEICNTFHPGANIQYKSTLLNMKENWMDEKFCFEQRVSGFIALILLACNMLAPCWQWLIKYGTTNQNDGMSLDSDNGLIMDRNNINNHNLYLHPQWSRHHRPSPPDRRHKKVACINRRPNA